MPGELECAEMLAADQAGHHGYSGPARGDGRDQGHRRGRHRTVERRERQGGNDTGSGGHEQVTAARHGHERQQRDQPGQCQRLRNQHRGGRVDAP